jgi:hypothetical protein
MAYSIVPTSEDHLPGLYDAFDMVAREKCYLAFLQAPPREHSYAFYRNIIANDLCQLVALDGNLVVGWCDVLPLVGESRAHIGTLGIGLVPHVRQKGLGAQLMSSTIDKA